MRKEIGIAQRKECEGKSPAEFPSAAGLGRGVGELLQMAVPWCHAGEGWQRPQLGAVGTFPWGS